METKKKYEIGDAVWIYGITRSNAKLSKGKIIATLDLTHAGYNPNIIHYVISIPNEIEPLLEIRTWETMSQDDKGPVGSLRDSRDNLYVNNKMMERLGYISEMVEDFDDISEEQIMAALEKSADGLTHKPLHIRDQKPKARHYNRKKKS